MAKYRRIINVEAELYSPGMEDGFDYTCNCACANMPKQCKDCACYNVPYVLIDNKKSFIGPGMYLVTDTDTLCRGVYTSKRLNTLYKKVGD